MNPFRLGCILLLFAAYSSTLQAQKIWAVGVSSPDECAFASTSLIRDLKGIGFPQDWTFVVACTATSWERLQRQGSANGVGKFESDWASAWRDVLRPG